MGEGKALQGRTASVNEETNYTWEEGLKQSV